MVGELDFGSGQGGGNKWDLWASLVEQTPVCIGTSDIRTGRFIHVNAAYERLTGYSLEELRRMSYLDLTHPEDRSENVRVVDEVARGKSPTTTLRKRYIRKDGSVVWVEVNVSVLRDSRGEPVCFAVITRGIDELIAAERQRNRTAERLREILEASTTGIIVNDPSGKFVYANPPLLRLLGYTAEELEAGELSWDRIQVPERRALDDRALEQLRATGHCDPYETELSRKDGSRVPVFVGAAFVPDDEGDGLLGTAFVTDLTPLRDVLDELVVLNEALDLRVRERTAELERANDELTGFTYHVSHDLRAPLRAIVATSRMLQQDYADVLPKDATALLQRQVAAANRLGTLIDELLKLTRLTREELHTVPLDVTRLARDVAEENTLENQQARIQVEDGLRAKGDPRLVRLLIGNLVANALRYSPQGGTVTVGRAETDRGPAFYVRDQGIGFDMQYADKLFKPFERLVTESEFPGTGVGLANVARIVAKHNGRVWAESELGKGATFYFTLPT